MDTPQPELFPAQVTDPDIAAVIPTRNRPESLHRLLASLARQRRIPGELLIVDASDQPLREEDLRASYPALPLRCLASAPSVCAQRNLGIRTAGAPFIFLCDDDMEPPEDYLDALALEIERHPAYGAVSGFWAEPDAAGAFSPDFPVPTFRSLLWSFVFQLTVWGDVEHAQAGLLLRGPLSLLKRWYDRRGNTFTLAGWPLVTQVGGRSFRTAVYTLGASLVRRDWLIDSPYDETLDADGIGDNYGVALGFPGEKPIVFCRDTRVLHHRAPENRAAAPDVYRRRILVLHSYLRRHRRYRAWKTAWLLWSLIGNTAAFLISARFRHAAATASVFLLICARRNPYIVRRRKAAETNASLPGGSLHPSESP